ncbi:MAG: hypothetical protein BIFFINMI_00279 [Phycisphaerae bacterium]|nr:hypothetical protein [Phycisphaerae bacterium]
MEPVLDRPDDNNGRTLIAILVGLLASLAIWIADPFTSVLLGTGSTCNGYLPSSVLLLAFVLVLVINPVLRLLGEGLAFSGRQLALIVAIALIASAVPGPGALRLIPYNIVAIPPAVSRAPDLAQRYAELRLPPSLFPDPLAYGSLTPNSNGFLTQLDSSQPIPWTAWTGPALTWGSMLLFSWMMMIGLAMIVLPQWRDNERLPFPLLQVQQAMIEPPQPRRLLPAIMRRRPFWIGVGSALLIYVLIGLNAYHADLVPAIPIRWDLTSLFTEEPWRQMPGYIKQHQVSFLFVGIAFFMSNRSSFSIWFFLVAYALWRAFAPYFGDNYYIGQMDDHRTGAILVMAGAVLWIGRAHWRQVAASLFRRPRSEIDRRDRTSGWLFLLGVGGMIAWMRWLGVGLPWAMIYVLYAFLVSLVVCRFVAETGVPVLRIYDRPLLFMPFVPITWITPVTVFAEGVIAALFGIASRASAAVLGLHALGMERDPQPRRQRHLGLGMLGVMAVGLVICGAVHLGINYRNSATLDIQASSPLNADSVSGSSSFNETNKALGDLHRGKLDLQPYNHGLHLLIGMGIAAALFSLCMRFPSWPLHPLGFLLIDSHFGHVGWASVFIGWAARNLIIRIGGAKLYEKSRPLFLGLIVGEVLAALLWTVVPLFFLWAGRTDFVHVRVLQF